MPPNRFDQALARAKQYATGELPVKHHTMNEAPTSIPGTCDYCNRYFKMTFKTPSLRFLLCWPCLCTLTKKYSPDFEAKISDTLLENRMNRVRSKIVKQKGSQMQLI